MLALAGYPLGMRFRFLDPIPNAPAGQVGEQILAPYDDPQALAAFARGLDVATFEFENVPWRAAHWLADHVPTFPSARALEVGQDRIAEKTLFQSVGLEVHRFAAADSAADLAHAINTIDPPVVIKTRRGGYDGRGQAIVRSHAEARDAGRIWAELGGVPLLVEKFVPFERELSVLGVRSRSGQFAAYPLVQNVHTGGILRRSTAPAPGVDPALQHRAESYARAVMEALGYVGALAIEFFESGGALLANEMAPRVHNSGHWTIEGAVTSQFENHLRAVAGLPLGSAACRGCSIMLNLIGGLPNPVHILEVPGTHLHVYGKDPRPGRKVGHVTITADSPACANERAARVEGVIVTSQA
jgi:5-(carboxyamino)imidazole ribonucleotide synthase